MMHRLFFYALTTLNGKSAESGEYICKQGKFPFRYASGVTATQNLLPEGRQRLP